MASSTEATSSSEVEDPILDTWEPFYAGWDATGFNGNGGVGIHHPSGDRKKISTYTNSAVEQQCLRHLGRIGVCNGRPPSTNHGVTEGGSSGSPILRKTTGFWARLPAVDPFATALYSPDYYGKMSYHWDGPNPIPMIV